MLYVALGILATALVLLVLNHESGQVAGLQSDDFAQLVWGGIMITVLSSALLFSYRGRLGSALKHALTWIAIALLLVIGYSFRAQFQQIGHTILSELVPGYGIESRTVGGVTEIRLKRRMDGHFAANVDINGVAIPMLVDTGASTITLTQADARRAGFDTGDLSYTVQVSTANGRTSAAPVRLDTVSIGSLGRRNLRALIARPGALGESLLGINFLSSIGSYEVRGDELILRARP